MNTLFVSHIYKSHGILYKAKKRLKEEERNTEDLTTQAQEEKTSPKSTWDSIKIPLIISASIILSFFGANIFLNRRITNNMKIFDKPIRDSIELLKKDPNLLNFFQEKDFLKFFNDVNGSQKTNLLEYLKSIEFFKDFKFSIQNNLSNLLPIKFLITKDIKKFENHKVIQQKLRSLPSEIFEYFNIPDYLSYQIQKLQQQ